MPRKGEIVESIDLKDYIHFGEWTAKTLRATRKKLKLTQKDIARFMGLTSSAISSIELGVSTNPWAFVTYGIILERYYAYTKGYVPAFRKIGENEFADVKLL